MILFRHMTYHVNNFFFLFNYEIDAYWFVKFIFSNRVKKISLIDWRDIIFVTQTDDMSFLNKWHITSIIFYFFSLIFFYFPKNIAQNSKKAHLYCYCLSPTIANLIDQKTFFKNLFKLPNILINLDYWKPSPICKFSHVSFLSEVFGLQSLSFNVQSMPKINGHSNDTS